MKFQLIIFLSILNIICFQKIFAQSSLKTDSLLQILQHTDNKKAKVKLLLKISNEENTIDPEKSLEFAKQARDLARNIDFDSAEIHAMIDIGLSQGRMNLLKEAIETGKQVVEKAERFHMPLEIADGRTVMAVAYAEGGDFDNSSKLYFENINLYEKLNEKRLLGVTMGNIGVDFIDQQSYEKGLEYVNKSLILGLETHNLISISDQYNNLAIIYYSGFHNLPKALRYFSMAFETDIKTGDIQSQGFCMLNIGSVYKEMNNLDSALF
jgi:tetratricopeptide (TPR) repeat protein